MLKLKLKLQYFGYLMRRVDSLERTLMLGNTEGPPEKKGVTEDERIIDSMDMSVSQRWEMAKDRKAWCAAFHGIAKSWTERLNNKRLFRKLHLFLAPHITSSVLISTVNQLLRCWMVATTRESTVGLWVKHPSAETSESAHSQFNATFWYLHLCSLCGIQSVVWTHRLVMSNTLQPRGL